MIFERTIGCALVLSLMATQLPAQTPAPKAPAPKVQTAKVQTAKVQTPKVEKRKLKYELQPPPAQFTPPVLSLAGATFNWGTVMQGEVVTHEYVLENKGGMPLKIERVKPACGCTTVNFDRLIPPGQSGKVTLKVDTKKFSGTIKKSASVYSNAGREPYKLIMTGKIETPLEFEPKLPRIDYVRGAQTTPLEVLVRRSSQRSIKFLGVKVDPKKLDLLSAKLEEVEPGDLYKLILTPTVPPSATKYHTIEVTVQTETDGKPVNIPIRVSIRVRDRIEATPPSIYFTRRDTDKLRTANAPPVTRTVEILSRDPNHTFKITDYKVLGSNFTVAVEAIEEGKKYRLTASLAKRPEGDSRRVVEKIVVNTNDELVPQITLNATASFGIAKTRSPGLRPQPLKGSRPTPAPKIK